MWTPAIYTSVSSLEFSFSITTFLSIYSSTCTLRTNHQNFHCHFSLDCRIESLLLLTYRPLTIHCNKFLLLIFKAPRSIEFRYGNLFPVRATSQTTCYSVGKVRKSPLKGVDCLVAILLLLEFHSSREFIFITNPSPIPHHPPHHKNLPHRVITTKEWMNIQSLLPKSRTSSSTFKYKKHTSLAPGTRILKTSTMIDSDDKEFLFRSPYRPNPF